MPNILAHDPIGDLPIYRDGFARGQDVGLRLALDALTAESIRQDQRMAAEPDSGSAVAARLAYTAAVLLDVSKVIGAPIPSVTHDHD